MDMNDRVSEAVTDSVSYKFKNYVGYKQEPHALMFWAGCVCGEAGEMFNKIKKFVRGTATLEETLPAAADELVDVLVYAFNLAAVLEIDLEAEYDKKVAFNRERFTT